MSIVSDQTVELPRLDSYGAVATSRRHVGTAKAVGYDLGRRPTVQMRRVLLPVPDRCPVLWCAEHYGPDSHFAGDDSQHHFAAAKDIQLEHGADVSVRLDRFDPDPTVGTFGVPVVAMSVDGVEWVELTPAEALRLGEVLTAQARLAVAGQTAAVA
jgi:hypothetical protein